MPVLFHLGAPGVGSGGIHRFRAHIGLQKERAADWPIAQHQQRIRLHRPVQGMGFTH